MKLLCFGDLHLGHGAQIPGRLDDQREVLGRIAGLAVEHGVDGILFAGDAFEGPASKITPEQLDVFAAFVAACRTVGIPVLAINGNGMHDAAVRDKNGLAIFNHIDGITVSSFPDVYPFAGCNVATLPWVHPGRLISRAGRDVPRDEVNAIVADLLVDVARRGIEDCRALNADAPAILLGHGQVSGTSLPTGLPVDTLGGPILPVDELEALGYDAIIFGDIHAPQPIGTTGLYTGSPMPLNFGEAHVDHGVWILDLHGAYGDVSREFVPIDSPRFVVIDAELAGRDLDDPLSALTEVLDAEEIARGTGLYDGSFVWLRYTVTAEQQRRIDVAALRHYLAAADARYVKITPQQVREQRARVAGVDEQLDELAALDLWLEASAIDGDMAGAMRAKTRDYLAVVA